MQDGTYRWSPGASSGEQKRRPDPRRLGKFLGIGAAVVVALLLVSTCWYTVDDKQQAVVTTFGSVTDVTGAGVHFKLPFGIQRVKKVDVNVYQKIELGYRTDPSATCLLYTSARPSKGPPAPPPGPGRCTAAAAGRRTGLGRFFSAGP